VVGGEVPVVLEVRDLEAKVGDLLLSLIQNGGDMLVPRLDDVFVEGLGIAD